MTLTLDLIYSLCEEVGDCLEWGGRLKEGAPVYGRDPIRVRRALFELTRGEGIPAGMYPVATCRNQRCLCDEHMALRTRKQIVTAAAKAGRLSTPSVSAARTKGRRKRADVKLSMEKAREIRASELSTTALSAQYGVTRALIRGVRAGRLWREGVQGASVFAFA